jgi:nitrite reductase/ring-hydroxylating ferredoxin subunit
MAHRLCTLHEIGDKGKEVLLQIDGKTVNIMLFRRQSGVCAFHNVCPHQGRNLNYAPDLFMFTPEGLLVCAHHGACFSLDDGVCVMGPCAGARLKSVAIVECDDEVWLDSDSEIIAGKS